MSAAPQQLFRITLPNATFLLRAKRNVCIWTEGPGRLNLMGLSLTSIREWLARHHGEMRFVEELPQQGELYGRKQKG